jgi:hypothetical protein
MTSVAWSATTFASISSRRCTRTGRASPGPQAALVRQPPVAVPDILKHQLDGTLGDTLQVPADICAPFQLPNSALAVDDFPAGQDVAPAIRFLAAAHQRGPFRLGQLLRGRQMPGLGQDLLERPWAAGTTGLSQR